MPKQKYKCDACRDKVFNEIVKIRRWMETIAKRRLDIEALYGKIGQSMGEIEEFMNEITKVKR